MAKGTQILPEAANGSDAEPMDQKPRYELEIYRQFIREAAPYVSVVIGRRIKASEANLMTDDELVKIALIIDSRVKDLKPPR